MDASIPTIKPLVAIVGKESMGLGSQYINASLAVVSAADFWWQLANSRPYR
jgi:hypothetical protein